MKSHVLSICPGAPRGVRGFRGPYAPRNDNNRKDSVRPNSPKAQRVQGTQVWNMKCFYTRIVNVALDRLLLFGYSEPQGNVFGPRCHLASFDPPIAPRLSHEGPIGAPSWVGSSPSTAQTSNEAPILLNDAVHYAMVVLEEDNFAIACMMASCEFCPRKAA